MPGVKGKSGPRPLPKLLKELKGTYREDQDNLNAPEPPILKRAPKCPDHLTGEARKTWNRLGKQLQTMGLLSNVDLDALEGYCVVSERWREAEEKLRQYGMMLSKDGMLFPSPYLKVAEESLKQLKSWMIEFGITPASRSRVSVEKKPETKVGDQYFEIGSS